ncbi:aa3-type cytochrome c oxidase subunit IV [Paracoccus rhizosphaerae]|uniref:Aa3-type cytochrome c oxidase subunit IV n=1 Tax=Paracoccus rhizosphaerae TaxID=1133347 RepID=A0ABV6CGH6_9RHOB|nr:aa3-type cytochrome c oxidase subunit IV [Paracoccus rhizosphaerae]
MANQHEKTEATPGTMDLTEHRKTFAGFLRMTQWVIILSLVVLIFLALTNA